MTLEHLRALAEHSKHIGTQNAFIDVALEFAGQAVARAAGAFVSTDPAGPTSFAPDPFAFSVPRAVCRVRFCMDCGQDIGHAVKP